MNPISYFYLKVLSIAFVATSLISLAGCGSRPFSREAAIPESEGILIMGIKGVDGVTLRRGTLANNKFIPAASNWVRYVPTHIEGYGIISLPPAEAGESYAVTQGSINRRGVFGICNWRQALTFSITKGKVTYIGDIDFTVRNEIARIETTTNAERALSFIRENFKNLPPNIEYVRPQLIGTC